MWFPGEPNESRLSSLALPRFILFAADRREIKRLIVASLLWAITMPLCREQQYRCYNVRRQYDRHSGKCDRSTWLMEEKRVPASISWVFFHVFLLFFCVITHKNKGPFLCLCGTKRAAITHALIQKGISFGLGYLYSGSVSLRWQGREQDVGNGNCLARAASQHAPHLEPYSSRRDRACCYLK